MSDALPAQRQAGGRRRYRRRGPPPSYSTTVVVVLGLQSDAEVDAVRNAASGFGDVQNVTCRTTRNNNFLYEIEYGNEAAAAAATNPDTGLNFGEDVGVAFKRLPRERAPAPQGNKPARAPRAARAARPPRPQPSYSTTVVVVLGYEADTEVDNVRAAATTFGNVNNVSCRPTRNNKFLYEIEFADEASAAQAVNQDSGLNFGDGTKVAFKRVPRQQQDLPRMEGDPTLVYVKNIETLNDDELKSLFANVVEISRRRRRFAFLRFGSAEDAAAAIQSRNGYTLTDDVALQVEPHRPIAVPKAAKAAPAAPAAQAPRVRIPVPSRPHGQPDPRGVVVTGPPEVQDDELKQFLASVAEVQRFIRRTKTTAFVTFTEEAGAQALLAQDGVSLASGIGPISFRPLIIRKRGQLDADTVFVGNIEALNDDAVRGFFQGNITEFDRKGHVAYVTFESEEQAVAALDQNGAQIDENTQLSVRRRIPRQPRRRQQQPERKRNRGKASRPKRQVIEGPHTRVFVANYNEGTSPEQILAAFPGAADVRMSRRSATIEFDTVDNAQAAVSRNGQNCLGDEFQQRIEFKRI